MKMFSVYDKKAECFSPPFFMRATGLALRGFIDMLNSGDKTQYSAHPEDFDLYELGEWNDETGKVDQYEIPRLLGNGLDYITKD